MILYKKLMLGPCIYLCLKGKSPREAWRMILQNYWPALKANW